MKDRYNLVLKPWDVLKDGESPGKRITMSGVLTVRVTS